MGSRRTIASTSSVRSWVRWCLGVCAADALAGAVFVGTCEADQTTSTRARSCTSSPTRGM